MDTTGLAKEAKQENIINMAIGFTAMIPFFQERSVDLIKEKLTDLFGGLERIWTDEDFSTSGNSDYLDGHIWPLANYDPFHIAVTDHTENAFMLILFKYQGDACVHQVFESWHSN